jgi:hypothetical protein
MLNSVNVGVMAALFNVSHAVAEHRVLVVPFPLENVCQKLQDSHELIRPACSLGWLEWEGG